ncbi:MAG: hypothetical protein OEZ36_11000 [Spirochaetota bacterium]|nr:hypothetical protein [Spirochaetota bacterium]
MSLIDSLIIKFYGITGNHVADSFLGNFLLGLAVILIGRLSLKLYFKINKRHMDGLEKELADSHRLSLDVLKSGDKETFRHVNRLANEAYGKYFFNKVAAGAVFIWPLFLSLAWINMRFGEIRYPLPTNLPLIGDSVSFIFVFLLEFLLTLLAVKQLNNLFQKRR